MSPPTTSTNPSGSKFKWLIGLLLLAIALVVVRAFHFETHLRTALEWIRGLGGWGPVLFIVLYVVATVFLIPGSVLTLGAGAVYGRLWGCVYCSVGATLGATAAFLVSRYLARDWVARRIAGNQTFTAIDKAVAQEGWKIVGLTRLSPIFPFVLLNYAFGVTRVSLRDYFLASWIGMMPGAVMYVYLGSLAGEAAEARQRTRVEWALYGVGLVATIVVTIFITRIARNALAKKIA